jgi:hypothetical protein
MSWFSNTPPKALIAGMHLTRDEAQILAQACQELERFITHQKGSTEVFSHVDPSDERYALKSIQEQHARIHRRLNDLVRRLRNHSKGPLSSELGEATSRMHERYLCLKYATSPLQMGWKAAAKKYWPRIARSYATLLRVLGSFKQTLINGLKEDKIWSKEAQKRNPRSDLKPLKSALKRSPRAESRPRAKGKHVVFDETVRWNTYSKDDAPKEVDKTRSGTESGHCGSQNVSFTKLATDEKQSTKRLHGMA